MVAAEVKGWEPGGDPAPWKRKRRGNIQCLALHSSLLLSGCWASWFSPQDFPLLIPDPSSLGVAPLGGEKPSYGCVRPGPGLKWVPGLLSDIAHDLVKDAKVLGVFPLFRVTRETP